MVAENKTELELLTNEILDVEISLGEGITDDKIEILENALDSGNINIWIAVKTLFLASQEGQHQATALKFLKLLEWWQCQKEVDLKHMT